MMYGFSRDLFKSTFSSLLPTPKAHAPGACTPPRDASSSHLHPFTPRACTRTNSHTRLLHIQAATAGACTHRRGLHTPQAAAPQGAYTHPRQLHPGGLHTGACTHAPCTRTHLHPHSRGLHTLQLPAPALAYTHTQGACTRTHLHTHTHTHTPGACTHPTVFTRTPGAYTHTHTPVPSSPVPGPCTSSILFRPRHAHAFAPPLARRHRPVTRVDSSATSPGSTRPRTRLGALCVECTLLL